MKLYVVLINLDRSYSIDYATYLFLLSLFTVSCLILFLNEKSRHFSCETCGLSRTEKRHENANSGVIFFRLFNVKIRNVIAVHTVMSVRRAWSHDAHIKRARPSDKEKGVETRRRVAHCWARMCLYRSSTVGGADICQARVMDGCWEMDR